MGTTLAQRAGVEADELATARESTQQRSDAHHPGTRARWQQSLQRVPVQATRRDPGPAPFQGALGGHRVVLGGARSCCNERNERCDVQQEYSSACADRAKE